MSFYSTAKKDWVAEPGQFDVLVGSSSRDIRVKSSFVLNP
jgi:beta-glucosidase